jgi:methyltransferase (TIGR00027 family)
MSLSRTSQAVAMTRAGFTRPHSRTGDPDAQRKLCAGMPSVTLPALAASLAARTEFFDRQVIGAIEAGVRQVVVLGAGYDDRALRFRTPGVVFYEVDHPATQADKRARLAAIEGAGRADDRTRRSGGLVLAQADFRLDEVGQVLARVGHDPELASLFLAEGLLVYLDQPTAIKLLDGARAVATPGSELAASLSVHAEGLDTEVVLARANARRRTSAQEPWLSILPASAQRELLASAGWRVTGAVDAADFGTGTEPGRSLLVTAKPTGE